MTFKFIQMGRFWWQGHGQLSASVSGLGRGFSEEREIPVPLSGQFISAGADSEVFKKKRTFFLSTDPFLELLLIE